MHDLRGIVPRQLMPSPATESLSIETDRIPRSFSQADRKRVGDSVEHITALCPAQILIGRSDKAVIQVYGVPWHLPSILSTGTSSRHDTLLGLRPKDVGL